MVTQNTTHAELRAQLLANARDIITLRQVGETLSGGGLAPIPLRMAYRGHIQQLEATQIALAEQLQAELTAATSAE